MLGIVENMSYFLCPHCGGRTDVFAHGGARHEAEALGVPFLGEIPLDIVIRETSDGGAPVVASAPDGPQAQAFLGDRRARARRACSTARQAGARGAAHRHGAGKALRHSGEVIAERARDAR